MKSLPSLSRFELQCLRKLWNRKEGTVRDIHGDLVAPPSYSTVRKIMDRLEEKGAIERVRKEGKAWVYRSRVSPREMLRKEVRQFLDVAFDGSAAPLVTQLARMNELTVEDLREVERVLASERAAANGGGTVAGSDTITGAEAPDARNVVTRGGGSASVGSDEEDV